MGSRWLVVLLSTALLVYVEVLAQNFTEADNYNPTVQPNDDEQTSAIARDRTTTGALPGFSSNNEETTTHSMDASIKPTKLRHAKTLKPTKLHFTKTTPAQTIPTVSMEDVIETTSMSSHNLTTTGVLRLSSIPAEVTTSSTAHTTSKPADVSTTSTVPTTSTPKPTRTSSTQPTVQKVTTSQAPSTVSATKPTQLRAETTSKTSTTRRPTTVTTTNPVFIRRRCKCEFWVSTYGSDYITKINIGYIAYKSIRHYIRSKSCSDVNLCGAYCRTYVRENMPEELETPRSKHRSETAGDYVCNRMGKEIPSNKASRVQLVASASGCPNTETLNYMSFRFCCSGHTLSYKNVVCGSRDTVIG